MDPATIPLAVLAFIAAEVGKKAADQATTALWERIKRTLKKVLGRDPGPEDLAGVEVHISPAELEALRDGLGAFLEQSPALRRAHLVQVVLNGARILWIDDYPTNNTWEVAFFEAAGARIRTAESTETALARLEAEPYDLVISDIARGSSPDEGLRALPKIRAIAPQTPVVFYVGHAESPPPAGSFGIADAPEELVHLVLDVLERQRL